MKEALLICAVAAVFALGNLAMKKLDVFLERNQTQLSAAIALPALSIAFDNSATIASVSDFLEAFLQANPACELRLFSGSAEDILKKLETAEIDFGFLTAESDLSSHPHLHLSTVVLEPHRFIASSVNLSVTPLIYNGVLTQIVWSETNGHPLANQLPNPIVRFYHSKQVPC